MATFTTAQMREVGVPPASVDRAGLPGPVMLEYTLDGSKRTIAATDIVHFFDLPPRCAMIVTAASVTVQRSGTATGTVTVGIGGTAITGLTGFSTSAAAGTEDIKLATGANTVVTGGTATALTLTQTTAGLGNGKIKVRVFGTLIDG